LLFILVTKKKEKETRRKYR